jgi:hypothetical protein
MNALSACPDTETATAAGCFKLITMPEPSTTFHHTTFDWRIYAEATCAGLTALVPLPFVDLALEAYFRRRMPATIAKVRERSVAAEARRRLGRGSGNWLSLEGCLSLPLAILRYIARKLWRKIIYVFAVADATSQVSEYWHRAYLLDHMIKAGHLGSDVDWRRAVGVAGEVLRETDTGPLMGLARQTVSSTHRVVRMLFRARRRGAVEETESLAAILRSHWDAAESSLFNVAIRYNEAYTRSLELEPPID